MVKNALQAQLLKAGLVDNKKAKKLSKQAVHEQRTGQSSEAELKAKIEKDQQEKQQNFVSFFSLSSIAKKAENLKHFFNISLMTCINTEAYIYKPTNKKKVDENIFV